ncbi:SGNH/GDSL hydrolase family protein [Bradyrhizobium liaoningense]|uniref:SGNH/GDSL hydrolase family protein n=1 Tax=Bradyrhizobium liaoningense TaxID=43992 RepID=UPI0005539EB6|nr:GDSL-type esterase/lipase family protein [Bradyrhizobium liaoningense]
MIKRLIVLALALLTIGTAAADEHSDVRQFVIRSQLAQAGDDAVVFVGDSITESALFPEEVCGKAIINAGVGGATASSYADKVLAGVPAFKPSLIVIALGTNDALAKNADFARDYERLVDILSTYSETVLLAGLPSVGESFDQEIRSIAQRKARPFIDLRSEKEIPTLDGIHVSPEGYKIWLHSIIGGVRAALHC